jgi:hypothetical protein
MLTIQCFSVQEFITFDGEDTQEFHLIPIIAVSVAWGMSLVNPEIDLWADARKVSSLRSFATATRSRDHLLRSRFFGKITEMICSRGSSRVRSLVALVDLPGMLSVS